ncbi:MAG TPA: glycosyl transferase [Candidatus Paceibacterota bacterium]|nr:glycosyl transferase [Candidatus Paceibacterota bacterium]
MARGLALYHSLCTHSQPFHLWILCLDRETEEFLKNSNLSHITLIPLKDFEDQALLSIKSTRTAEEYFWTCTPSLPLYVLKNNPTLETIAYLDADLYFYFSPEPLYTELETNSIYIIPHRFPPQKKYREEIDGIFNVGMLIFKNNTEGNACLNWWRERCIEWCYRTPENGKMGDQKYLDSFPKLFSGVTISKHKGACVAPWNIKNYKVTKKENTVYIDDQPLIFYHFFRLPIYKPAHFLPLTPPSHYTDWSPARLYIYDQYIRDLAETIKSSPDKLGMGAIERPQISVQLISGIRSSLRSMRRRIFYLAHKN